MKTLRIGICLLTAFSVLAFGAVQVWAVSILEIGAGLLFLWWGITFLLDRENIVRWPAVIWPLLIYLGYVTVPSALGTTATAFLTRAALLKIAACFILFFLCAQAFRSRKDFRFLAWLLMVLAFAVGLFGIIQSLTSNGDLYWMIPVTHGGTPIGPYVNRDHFSGLMELLAPIGLAMFFFRGLHREQLPVVGILTLVPVIALILSGSRGGIASFAFEIALLAVIAHRRKSGKVRLSGTVAILLAALAMGLWLGANQVLERSSHLKSDALTLERRGSMFEGAWRLFLAHPAFGSGLGSFVDVYPRFETEDDGKIVEHAHDDYVELLAETGIFGGICGLAFLVLFFQDASRRLAAEQSSFSLALHAAGVVACGGLLLHSLVDFNLHIPANGLMFLLLASLAISPNFPRARLQSPRDPLEIPSPLFVDTNSRAVP